MEVGRHAGSALWLGANVSRNRRMKNMGAVEAIAKGCKVGTGNDSISSLDGLKNFLLNTMTGNNVATPASGSRATIWLTVTPELAESLLRHMMYRYQRKLLTKRFMNLAKAIVDGELLNNNTIWTCVTKADEWQVINAQHTLQAIIQSDIPVELQMVIDYVSDMAEVARRYARFDIGGLRSNADIVHAAQFNEGLIPVDSPDNTIPVAKGVAAVGLLRHNLFNQRQDDRIGNMTCFTEDWSDEFRLINTALRPLLRAIAPSENEQSGVINMQMKGLRQRFRVAMVLAVFMLATKAHPDETIMLINAMVDRCRSGEPYDDSTVETLFNYLCTSQEDFLHSNLRPMLLANIAKCIIAHRDEEPIKRKDFFTTIETVPMTLRGDALWIAITDNEVPRYVAGSLRLDRGKIIKATFAQGRKRT